MARNSEGMDNAAEMWRLFLRNEACSEKFKASRAGQREDDASNKGFIEK